MVTFKPCTLRFVIVCYYYSYIFCRQATYIAIHIKLYFVLLTSIFSSTQLTLLSTHVHLWSINRQIQIYRHLLDLMNCLVQIHPSLSWASVWHCSQVALRHLCSTHVSADILALWGRVHGFSIAHSLLSSIHKPTLQNEHHLHFYKYKHKTDQSQSNCTWWAWSETISSITFLL